MVNYGRLKQGQANMAKQMNEKTTATVKDYSNGQDGSKTVDVPYEFSWVTVENEEELDAKYTLADLFKLATAREKASANSAARAKAVAPYAQDPNSEAAIRTRLIADLMKLGKTREQATAMVESA